MQSILQCSLPYDYFRQMLSLRSQRLFTPLLPYYNEQSSKPSLKQLQDCFVAFFISPCSIEQVLGAKPVKSLEFKVLPLPISLLRNCCCNITADFAVLMQLPCQFPCFIRYKLNVNDLLLPWLTHTHTASPCGDRWCNFTGAWSSLPGQVTRLFYVSSGQQKKNVPGKAEMKPYSSFTAVHRILPRNLSFLLCGHRLL